MANDKVTCMLCGLEFCVITHTHLESAHSITPNGYLAMFPRAELTSRGTRWQMSDSQAGRVHSEETKQQMSESHLGRPKSEETKQKLSEALTNYHAVQGVSEETRQKLSKAGLGNKSHLGQTLSEETCRLISEGNLGQLKSDETRRKLSESNKESWKDPELIQRWSESMKQAQHRRPNESELQLQSVLDRRFPDEWKYVGDGQVWIGSKNPDFINVSGKRQVIELFGAYWHDPILFPNRLTEGELIAYYKSYGFDCLVIWEYDVWNEEEVVRSVKEVPGRKSVYA